MSANKGDSKFMRQIQSQNIIVRKMQRCCRNVEVLGGFVLAEGVWQKLLCVPGRI